MQKNKRNIEEEVQKTLAELDKEKQLPPDPYFFTRVQQRLEEKHKSEITVMTVLKPAFFSLILFINVITAIWQIRSIQEEAEKSRREQLMEVFIGNSNNQSNASNTLRLN